MQIINETTQNVKKAPKGESCNKLLNSSPRYTNMVQLL